MFLEASAEFVLGQLLKNAEWKLSVGQQEAWAVEIRVLKDAPGGLPGWIFLEFAIPRMGRRADAVWVAGPVNVVMEFKVGARAFDQSGIDQVWDYALDLKNFHEASHAAPIVPVLIATDASSSGPRDWRQDEDLLFRPLRANAAGLAPILHQALERISGTPVDPQAWLAAPYHPTPTIIEAARALYASHSVEAIARSDAGARNLHRTTRRLDELIRETRGRRGKSICFVTGVPGAGKTLAGLNLAAQGPREPDIHAVYLSGNGPLIGVLREALTRDEISRRRQHGEQVRKNTVAERVKAFIQNVHHFRDETLTSTAAPPERVVILDEAQRAWNAAQTTAFMRRRRRRSEAFPSEPGLLIGSVDRHSDWAVIVCLVGEGQEIHNGEAGLAGWLEAIARRFRHWHLYTSSELREIEPGAHGFLTRMPGAVRRDVDEALHLAVSMRSFRAERVSAFVNALLDLDRCRAEEMFSQVARRYPIAATRDLQAGRAWLEQRARGSKRYGLVASSRAMRLKPYAVDVRVSVDPVQYFLGGKDDPRSSYYLEDVATEFNIQGLELDWACVCWHADFRLFANTWEYGDFRGKRWCRVGAPAKKTYIRNAYRVLLTRPRQGMVIFVPPGHPRDSTRLPEYYDSTYRYLREVRIPEIG